MIPLPNEQEEWYEKTKICHICKENFEHKYPNDKNYRKVKEHCPYTGKYRGTAQSICNLKYSISKEIAVVFHNQSNCDYHFIIKELAKEFEGKFTCLGENTEKCKTFVVPIKKEVKRIGKNGEEIT